MRDAKTLDDRLFLALETARERGLEFLPESIGFAVARGLGLRVPHRIEISSASNAASIELDTFGGDRLVVKALSASIAHKSDVGAVAVCARERSALEEVLSAMEQRLPEEISVAGYSVHEYIEHDRGLGGELLLGLRWTDDFGPVAVLGLGGLGVDRLSAAGAFAPVLLSEAARNDEGQLIPKDHPLVRFLTEPYRGQPQRLAKATLEELANQVLALGDRFMTPHSDADPSRRLDDFEINPMVMTDHGLTALDVLIRPASHTPGIALPRPMEKLGCLLEPSSIAIAGVSRRQNIGHIILNNVLRQGFAPERVWVVKPGAEEIEGCRCVPDFSSLPEPVDLAVLSVDAAQSPDLVEEIIRTEAAQSLILIPGGLGEREGSENHAARLESAIRRSRTTRSGGPVVNGGNCLGVRSVPGCYDTLFIPPHKLSFESDDPAPLALLSQSGAFAVARASKLDNLNPTYVVTFGNQIDLTLGDYLTYLDRDPKVSVFACYVEGFRPLDGCRFLDATRRITASGKAVILYRAGRTPAGARAAASHTASVAGSYRITRELARRAGALVADTLEDFEDLVRIFTLFGGRRPSGSRLGALSNAGFESVAIGDNLERLELAVLGAETRSRITDLFRQNRIDTIVAPRNPLDVTPVFGDEAYAEAARAVLEDGAVDIGLLGCVPLTPALQTLPAGHGHGENVAATESIAQRLVEIWRTGHKPWVVVIDGGRLYDPIVRILDMAGIPTFRSADRALGALTRWVSFYLDQS